MAGWVGGRRRPPGRRRRLAEGLANAAATGRGFRAPYDLELIQLAEKWGVPPWELLTADPEQSRWVRRGLVYRRMLDQAEAAHQKNVSAKMRRPRG